MILAALTATEGAEMTAAQSVHNVAVRSRRPQPRKRPRLVHYYAVCECGWKGRTTQSEATARDEADAHEGVKTTRTILVHLNVEVPDTDQRSANMIADDILAAWHVGYEGSDQGPMEVVCPLAEEV